MTRRITVPLEDGTLDLIDEDCERYGITRSEVVLRIVEATMGLPATERDDILG